MRRALGRGLDSLIRKTGGDTAVTADNVASLPIGRISPNRYQPRKVFSDESLRELADSIKTHGLNQPVVVVRRDSGEYELISGERRWRACQLAGFDRIDAIVREGVSEEQLLALSLIENIQREDLNAIDVALAYKQLVDSFGVAQTEIAQYCGKSRSSVSNSLRLLELPTQIQKAVQTAAISEGHARALLTVPDRNERLRLFHTTLDKKLSVRDLELSARSCASSSAKPGRKGGGAVKSPELADLESRLQTALATRVRITPGRKAGTGTVSVQYHTVEDLERLSDRLL